MDSNALHFCLLHFQGVYMSERIEELEPEDALAAAQRVSETVKNADNYDELASAIAHRYAMRSDFNRAVEIADTINDPFAMEESIAAIAVMLSAVGREADAFELVESLEDFSHQATATSRIAVAHAVNGDFDRAIEVASGMDDNASTLVDIAYQFADKGQYERALEITEDLDFPLGSVWVRTRIAQDYSKAGRTEEALQVLSQALEQAEEIDPPNEKAGTDSEIALRFFELGVVERSREILAQALADAKSSDKIYRDAALAQAAAGHARLKLYDSAVSIAEAIDSVYMAASTLIDLALIEHEDESRRADALQLLSDAFDLIVEEVPETQRDEAQRHHLLARIALVNANFGLVDRALRAAKSIGEPDERAQVVSSVAVRLAEVSKYDEVRTALQELDDESHMANALVKISQVANAAGIHDEGTEFLVEATKLVEKIEHPVDRVHTLMELAGTFKTCEDAKQLASMFTQALSDTKLITSEFQKVAALLSIADACAKTKYEMDEESKELLWEIVVV